MNSVSIFAATAAILLVVSTVSAGSDGVFGTLKKLLKKKEKQVATATADSGYRSNVQFGPLDPKNTDPTQFWMPVENPVPNSYCQNPRYPIVPTFGDIAMSVLHTLWPNGTVPAVPPKPTNTWQKNLWGFNFSDHSNWGAVYPYPYIVQPRDGIVSLMYPGAPRNETGNRAMIQGFTHSGPAMKNRKPIANASYPWMVMSAAFDFAVQINNGMYAMLGEVGAMNARVDYYYNQPPANNKPTAKPVAKLHIVKGSPFVTFELNNAALQFGAPGPYPPIIGVKGITPGEKMTGSHIVFQVAEGPLHMEAQEWHAFFSTPVTVTLPDPPNQPIQIVGRGAGGTVTGTLKLATGEMDDKEGTWLRSIQHTVATSATVSYDMDDAKNQSTMKFNWKTLGNGPLTMLALPHHARLIRLAGKAKAMNLTKTKYWCNKGNMTAITGNSWNLTYNLSSSGFSEKIFVVNESKKAAVRRAALLDYSLRVHRCPGDNDTYNGTQGVPGYMNLELYAYVRDLSQYSEIATILESVGMRSHAVNLTKKVLECIKPVMKRPEALPYPCPAPINGTLQCVRDMQNVYYDTKWGGLITGWFDRFAAHYCQCDKPGDAYACRGYNYCDNPRAWDGFSNYGNAFYNDHHFQYGYLLKSLGWAIYFQKSLHADLNMSESLIANYTKQALAFARDIANPDEKKDRFFTTLRHKDVFDGHSWAEGYDYSGRSLTWVNQQSGGEAIMGYYGVYLIGLAINDTNVRDWGRIHAATEAFSIHQYQHLSNETAEDNDLPTQQINQWGRCLSILIGNGASGATYYGANPLFQCGITLLPVMEYHKEWIRPEWAREAARWIRWHDERTGECYFYNPLNQSQVDNNPCPGVNQTKNFTGNAWGCCPDNLDAPYDYPLQQWRMDPRWVPYLYILDSIGGNETRAWEELNYTQGFDKPTKELWPYLWDGRVVGFSHDITVSQALKFVATNLRK